MGRLKNLRTDRIAKTVIEAQTNTMEAKDGMKAAGDLLRLARLELETFEEERRRLDSQRSNLIAASNSDPNFIKIKSTLLHELFEKETAFEAAVSKWTDSLEERGRSGRADLSKFAEKAKSLTETSASAQHEIASVVREAEVISATGNAYSKVKYVPASPPVGFK